jgi:hypothetical protein
MKNKFKWWYGALLFVVVLSVLAPLASTFPDGLERVAADKGFIAGAIKPILKIAPDYTMPGLSSRTLSVILAALIGSLVLFGLGYGLAKLLRTKSET